MKKILLVHAMIATFAWAAFCQQQNSAAPVNSPKKTEPPRVSPAEEKYEPVEDSDFHIYLRLSGSVETDDHGVANGGPIVELGINGHSIELADKMIKDGFITTKDYGKFLIKPNYNMSAQLFLTPSQQKKLKALTNSSGGK